MTQVILRKFALAPRDWWTIVGLFAVFRAGVGTAFELAENYRYRFLIEPLFMVLTATAATSLLRRIRT